MPRKPDTDETLQPEAVSVTGADRLAHLAVHRGLIVRRSLLATALAGLVPLPMLDDLLANRLRVGLYRRLAAQRGVDLPLAVAERLALPVGGAPWKKVSAMALTMAAAKLAWKKAFFLVAAGRGADTMAELFQAATLFDHYAARLHVGGRITEEQGEALRQATIAALARREPVAIIAAFREGASQLARSLPQAPRWLAERLTALTERFVRSGGNPDVILEASPPAEEDGPWIDRAAAAVDSALSNAGNEYLQGLVEAFEAQLRT